MLGREQGRRRRVGTLDVLSRAPLSSNHSASFSTLSGRQFSSLSQNSVTPRRAHPETDDKVHSATPAYHRNPLRLLPLHTRTREPVHARGYLYKKTDEGLCPRSLKKKKKEENGEWRVEDRVSKNSLRFDRLAWNPIYLGFLLIRVYFFSGQCRVDIFFFFIGEGGNSRGCA